MFYVVRTLSPYTEYEFYIFAVNNIGRGPPSAPATCTTGETGKFIQFPWSKIQFSHIQYIYVCRRKRGREGDYSAFS